MRSCESPQRARTRSSPLFYSTRSEEHTSELQSRLHLVCRLLLEKKKKSLLHPLGYHCRIKHHREYILPLLVTHATGQEVLYKCPQRSHHRRAYLFPRTLDVVDV